MVNNKLPCPDLRKEVYKNPSLKQELIDSMAQPITHLCNMFMAMKIKEEPVKFSEPAKDEEI